MIFIYNLFIRLYVIAIRIAALWNKKAANWIEGRKTVFENLEKQINENDRVIWVHCASAGELEQGKPVIEALKESYPGYKILVSFFSPSGFTAGKKYKGADIITYLPADTSANAKRFIEKVHPALVVFIKYEYWYHHLAAAAFRHIPIILVSAIFRKDAVFFKWYGRFHRQMLFLFRQLFVQDETSRELLEQHGITHVAVNGDTRFDRVTKIGSQFSEIDLVKAFVQDEKVIVAGSTWPDDEKMLASSLALKDVKLVIAPHEIHPGHISSILKLFPGAARYSEFQALLKSQEDVSAPIWQRINEQQSTDVIKKLSAARVLIIDNFGMLSRLYYYATISYIGGGFNKSGIHNTLEAAVFGKPVIFGPRYHKFREAKELIAKGAAYSFQDANQLQSIFSLLLNDNETQRKSGLAATEYVSENRGASERVISYIQEKRLLTS